MSEERMTLARVAELRAEWAEGEKETGEMEMDVANSADALSLGIDPANTEGVRAAVSAARAETARLRLEYEDARDALAGQQVEEQTKAADQLARTNTKLAHVQAWLAGAITLATVAQVILAGLALWRTW